MLLEWYNNKIPREYSVSDFMEEIQKWSIKGYLDDDVWDRLRADVNIDVVPVPSRGVMRKHSNYFFDGNTTTATSIKQAPCTAGIANTSGKQYVVPSAEGRSLPLNILDKIQNLWNLLIYHVF